MLLTHMSQSRCHVQVAQTYSFVVCWLCKKTPHSACAMAGLEGFVTRELATPLVSTSQPAGAFQQLLLLPLIILLLLSDFPANRPLSLLGPLALLGGGRADFPANRPLSLLGLLGLLRAVGRLCSKSSALSLLGPLGLLGGRLSNKSSAESAGFAGPAGRRSGRLSSKSSAQFAGSAAACCMGLLGAVRSTFQHIVR